MIISLPDLTSLLHYGSNLTLGQVNNTLLPVQWAVTVLPFMKEINHGAVLICSCYPSHY